MPVFSILLSLSLSFSVQKGVFIIAQGQNAWAEKAALVLWGAVDYILWSWGR